MSLGGDRSPQKVQVRGAAVPWPGHTSLGERGFLPRWWLALKEGLGGTISQQSGHTSRGGTGSPAQAEVGAQGNLRGGGSFLRPGHTGLGGRGFLPRWWLALKEGLGGTISQQSGHTSLGGTGSPAQAEVGAQGNLRGGGSFLRPGHTGLGGRGFLPRWWLALKEGLGGTISQQSGHTSLGGTGSPAQAEVGAQGNLTGGGSFLRPGHTGLGGRGFLPRWWLALKEGLGGTISQQSGHTSLGGTGSPAQAEVGAQGNLRGGGSFLRPGHTGLGGWGFLPRWWSALKRGLGGTISQQSGHTSLGGTGSPAQAEVGAQGNLTGGGSFLRPGHTGLGGRGFLPRWWLALKEGLGHTISQQSGHTSLGGTGSPAQAEVGAQGNLTGGGSSLRPGHTGLGGWAFLPRWWLALKEGLGGTTPYIPGKLVSGGREALPKRRLVLKKTSRGAVASYGPGTPACGDGHSCLGGGWRSRRALGAPSLNSPGKLVWAGREALPKRRSVLKETSGGAVASYGPGTPALGDGHSCLGGGWRSRRALGAPSLNSPGTLVWGGREALPKRRSVLKETSRGAVASYGPGTPAWGDGEQWLVP